MGENKDSLDGWRESISIYAGDSEYDATVEAIKAYEEEQKRLEKDKKEKSENEDELIK